MASALVLDINDMAAVKPLKEVLSTDRKGLNKIYLKPDNDEWDITIELPGGYAFADGGIISRLKAIPGVSAVKEI